MQKNMHIRHVQKNSSRSSRIFLFVFGRSIFITFVNKYFDLLIYKLLQECMVTKTRFKGAWYSKV